MAVVSLTDKIKFIESVFGSGKLARNSRNFDVRCPICAPKDPSKKKLAILLEDDRCHCWTCGFKAHTLAPLIRKYGTQEKLIEYRDRFMSESERHRRRFDIDVEQKPKLTLPKDFQLIVTSTLRDPDALAIRRHLQEPLPKGRGLSERDLWYFKVGYSNDPRWKRRAIVPSFNANGELNYFVGRAIDKFRKPKYDNPDEDKLPIIFNELNIDWKSELVLCEGVLDLMKCPDNTVPLLGSDLNEQSALFNAILVNGTPIILALDDDMRIKKTPKIAKKLAEYNIDVKIVRLPKDSDPGSLSKVEMKQLVAEARPFSWDDVFFEKLDFFSRTTLSH